MADDEKELKDQRVVTMMTPSELEEIDNWMFANRIRSRGEAIRRLCQIGLAADEHFVAMLESHLAVSSAAIDVAANTQNDADAMKVLKGVSDFWQRFGRLRGVVLPMRNGATMEEAFADLKEIREAWEQQDPDGARRLMTAYLKLSRDIMDKPDE